MKIHRFIGPFDLSKKEININGEIAYQMIKVLKLKPKELVEICDGQDKTILAKIIKINEGNVIVQSEKILKTEKTGKITTLFCAILKKENFELVVQKTTECGISKIVPIISVRTIKTGLNLERLKKIAKEASEQSGRAQIPEIIEPINFSEALKLTTEKDLNIFFDVSGEKCPNILNDNPLSVNIFIGPEGGWTKEEIEQAKSLNFKIISLGPLTLRGETAAIISSYLVQNLN